MIFSLKARNSSSGFEAGVGVVSRIEPSSFRIRRNSVKSGPTRSRGMCSRTARRVTWSKLRSGNSKRSLK